MRFTVVTPRLHELAWLVVATVLKIARVSH
jgi:hypothetical protein